MSETTEVKGQFGLDQSGGTGKKLKMYFLTDMCSKFYKKPVFGPGGQERQWLNAVFSMHDTFCGCECPASHLKHLLESTETALPMERWLHLDEQPGNGDPTKDGDTENINLLDDLDDGILEKLFEEEPEKEDTR